MNYYSTWQKALLEYIEKYGHNYQDSYNLVVEFEQYLNRNSRGTYFLEDLR